MKKISKNLSDNINEYIKKRVESDEDSQKPGYNKKLADMISVKFDIELETEAVRARRKRMNLTSRTSKLSTADQMKRDKYDIDTSRERNTANRKYKAALDQVESMRKELASALDIKEGIAPFEITLRESKNDSDATAVVVASDWHIEEIVKSEKVNGMNEHNLTIARRRAEQFFQNTLKLVHKEQQNAKIDTLVVALLGDFISGNIHEELLENCELRPVEAMIEAQNMIVSGIMFLLRNSKLKLVIPCHVGNHTRLTKKVHISTEQGNSLETFMYHNLKNYFRGNKRVEFLIAGGYHSYLKIYDFTIRFHHGHALKYGGGIGGLFIPAFKAISQWQKIKHADLDVFGHFHSAKDGGNFISNGSNIGYNAFALSLKADYERPKQMFFLLDRKRGCKTVTCPIIYDC